MKRISPGTVTVGVLAILFGLMTAYAARHFGSPPPEPPKSQTATLVTPKVNLSKYSRIREEDIELIEVPIDEVPQDALRIKSRALLRLVKTTIMAGEPILEDDLYGVGEVPLLADQLPPGYRAVTLQVDAGSALNGMIQPESYVDIALTVKSKRPETGGLSTLTLLRGAHVLATSQARFPRDTDRPTALRNITVAVSPKEANRLILAQRFGTLSVTLRSNLEEGMLAGTQSDNDLVNPNDLLGLAYQPVPEPIVKTAQIWRGGQMQQITFQATAVRESLDATADTAGFSYTQPTPAVEVSSRQPAAVVPHCKECEEKQRGAAASPAKPIEPTTSAVNVPTLAPPQGAPSLAAGDRLEPRQRGQVIFVQVQAEELGSQRN